MSLFGGQAPATQPSMFGAPQSAPSLFGSAAVQSAPAFGAPSGPPSLFGAPASSASLFGAPASSASVFGAPASSASLFGAPASSASLFGAPASSASLFAAPASASLFGAPASSSSLFGAPANSASMFGAAPQNASLFAGAQQQNPAQNTQPLEITGRTRISQLPQNFQTDLFAVERHLREQRSKASLLSSKREDVESRMEQNESRGTSISRRLTKLNADLEALQANADAIKSAVRTERASAHPVMTALENLIEKGNSGFLDSNGLSYGGAHGSLPRAAHVPNDYFARILEDLEARSHEYKNEIDEIAEFLKAQGIVLSSTSGAAGKQKAGQRGQGASLLDSLAQRHTDIGLPGLNQSSETRGKTIEEIIRRQYEYFMVVASHIAGVHENLRSVKEQFLQILTSRDRDAPDPFEVADLREKAEKDRQRLMAERRAAEDTMGFANTTPQSSSSQPSLFQSQSGMSGLASTTGGFGTSSGGFGAISGGFGSGPSTGAFGSSTFGGGGTAAGDNGTNGSQAKRMAGGRRKRS